MASVDLYATLDVARDADLASIKRSFKKLALAWHPDKNNSEDAPEKFQKLNEAYAILSDPEKRRFYDKATSFLNRGSSSGNRSSPNIPTDECFFEKDAPSPKQTSADEHDSADSSKGPQDAREPHFQADSFSRVVTRKLAVSLEELFFGFHKRLKVARKVEDMNGNVTTSSVILTVNGLPGWRGGTKLTFSEAGDKRFGVPAQDVTVVIEEEPHPVFRRQGDDLIMNVQVPLFNALYGYTEHIETIDGKKINVPITRVSPGMIIALPGEGMPNAHGQRGDLVLRYRIALPAPARDSIRAVASAAQGPTDWRDISVPCSSCHELYTEGSNSDDACFIHEGYLVNSNGLRVFSGSQSSSRNDVRLWSCCRRPEASLGCVCFGKHTCVEDIHSKARATAAYNGLLAAARLGDPYATAWFMLDCSVQVQLAPIRAAVTHGHFLSTLLFVRDGADLSSLGGPTEALQLAAMHDKELSPRLLHAMAHEHELFDLFACTPGAPHIAFAQGCRQGDTDLCQGLLLHPRVGATRCGVNRIPALAATLLLASARKGNHKCCRVLVDAGIDVNALDRSTGRSAMHYVAEAGFLPMIELLLTACARTCDADYEGLRPLDLAINNGHGECVVHLETAMLEEALLSMAGLTLLRLLMDRVNTPAPASSLQLKSRKLIVSELRPAIVVLQDALQSLCSLSQSMASSNSLGSVDPAGALEAYHEWRPTLGSGCDVFTRNQSARAAVDALISAGVALKTILQEHLSSIFNDD